MAQPPMKQADLFQVGRPTEALDYPGVLAFIAGLVRHTTPKYFSEVFILRELVGEVRALRRVKDDAGESRYIVVNLEALKSWIVEQSMGAHPAWPYHALPEGLRVPPTFWSPDRRKPWERKDEEDD